MPMRSPTLITWLGAVGLSCSLALAVNPDAPDESQSEQHRCIRQTDDNHNPDPPPREINLCAVDDGEGPVPLGGDPESEDSARLLGQLLWIMPRGQLLIIITPTP